MDKPTGGLRCNQPDLLVIRIEQLLRTRVIRHVHVGGACKDVTDHIGSHAADDRPQVRQLANVRIRYVVC